ncbi:MAG: HAMP domain-containing histidine kinase [Oscillospiraceae bacterium]|nr:HAMP domain-containing histidine kinase [Oscillospiraceae bacterium]
MSERLHPALEQHKLFTYARLTAIGFLALSIVAFAVGLCGIHLFKEHVHERTAASSEAIIESLEEYAVISDQYPSRNAFSGAYVQDMLNSTSAKTNMALYLLDSDGVCIACSENSGILPDKVSVSRFVLKELKDSGSLPADAGTKLNPNETRPVMCSGFTFTTTDDNTYYLFANTFTDEIEHFIRSVLLTGFVSVIVMLSIYILFQCWYSKSYRNPEATLARVLRRYAQGDYSEILDPESFSSPVYRDIVRSVNLNVENLKNISQQQAEFVSNVSHELRTPMTIISGYVDGMLDGTIPKEKRTEYLYIVSQEMQRLKILISSMLNLTKFEKGTIQMKRDWFSINDLIFRTVVMFGNRLEKRNISVEGLDCATVRAWGDSDLIGQVVYNLTENAVKFVDTGGTISFRIEETKDAAIFAVRNTGAGIPKDEITKVFGRFYKSDFSRSQDKTGLGLGLDIIRKILNLHGGQIGVTSEVNVFTEFVVSLPKKSQTENADA